MKIKGKTISCKQIVCLLFYYGILYYFPSNTNVFFGRATRRLRYLCCRNIFMKCGKNINVERKAYFASGRDIMIGDNSGIGINCCIPGNTVIGEDVMMGPNVCILDSNHAFCRIDIPMIQQGFSCAECTVIEDDVWIGRSVLMTPGRRIQKGSIIAGGTVLCKNFPEYSIVGGNPSKLIRSRNE